MTPEEIQAAARAAVAGWNQNYTAEEKAELRRLLLGGTQTTATKTKRRENRSK